ncbi:hypothetical protein [Streptomyces humi]|uniref:hypothetical protein n=1 Tax=Streptomyces humi TaxID=1428620 RepID=UPI00062891F4|nr:hypothetical protein [Streptomyces humi]
MVAASRGSSPDDRGGSTDAGGRGGHAFANWTGPGWVGLAWTGPGWTGPGWTGSGIRGRGGPAVGG